MIIILTFLINLINWNYIHAIVKTVFITLIIMLIYLLHYNTTLDKIPTHLFSESFLCFTFFGKNQTGLHQYSIV